MNDTATRQHYRLAQAQPLDKTPGGKHPGYKKGGTVKCKSGGSAMRKSGRGR